MRIRACPNHITAMLALVSSLLEQEPVYVSIVIPVYNDAQLLPRALNSAVSQTLQNLEIVVVNDGSTDATAEVLEFYQKVDKRVRVIDLPNNSGTFVARTAGARAARGKYLLFLDADDSLESDKTAYVTFKRANATEASVLHFNEIGHQDGLTKLYEWANPTLYDERLRPGALRWFLRTGRGTALHGKLIDRSVFLRVLDLIGDEPLERKLRYCEDILIMIMVYATADKYVGFNHSGYNYYFRWESVTGRAHLNDTEALMMAQDTAFVGRKLL